MSSEHSAVGERSQLLRPGRSIGIAEPTTQHRPHSDDHPADQRLGEDAARQATTTRKATP